MEEGDEEVAQPGIPKTFEEMTKLVPKLACNNVKDNRNIYNTVMQFFNDESKWVYTKIA